MTKDHIRREGVELPKKYCERCSMYVQDKCRPGTPYPNAPEEEVTHAVIPAGCWWAIVVISIIAAFYLFG